MKWKSCDCFYIEIISQAIFLNMLNFKRGYVFVVNLLEIIPQNNLIYIRNYKTKNVTTDMPRWLEKVMKEII